MLFLRHLLKLLNLPLQPKRQLENQHMMMINHLLEMPFRLLPPKRIITPILLILTPDHGLRTLHPNMLRHLPAYHHLAAFLRARDCVLRAFSDNVCLDGDEGHDDAAQAARLGTVLAVFLVLLDVFPEELLGAFVGEVFARDGGVWAVVEKVIRVQAAFDDELAFVEVAALDWELGADAVVLGHLLTGYL